jgi:hypothetical protein
MSALNFLFGTRGPAGFSVLGLVSFNADLTISENHERRAEVTDHPVESGSTISDHVILAPERLRLEGFVTDSPAAVMSTAYGRTQSAFEQLEQAWRDRIPLQVITGRKTYQDMIIESLDLPRNRPESMRFTIDLKQIKIVQSETAALPQTEGGEPATDSADTADLATPRTDNGRQQSKLPAIEDEDQYQSTLKALGDKWGFFD